MATKPKYEPDFSKGKAAINISNKDEAHMVLNYLGECGYRWQGFDKTYPTEFIPIFDEGFPERISPLNEEGFILLISTEKALSFYPKCAKIFGRIVTHDCLCEEYEIASPQDYNWN